MKRRPVVLLVSGWAHGVEVFDPIASVPANVCRVDRICLDDLHAEGDQGSDAGRSRRLMSPYAHALAKRVEMEDGPVCLVGWSTGAMVVLEAAASLPDGRISGLALLSATALFLSDGEYSCGQSKASLRAVKRALRKDPRAALEDFFVRAAYPEGLSGAELSRRMERALKSGVESLIRGLDYLQSADLRDCLRSLRMPCIALHGKEDRIVSAQAALFLGDRIPNCEVRILPGVGHMLIERGREDLIRWIAEFPKDPQ